MSVFENPSQIARAVSVDGFPLQIHQPAGAVRVNDRQPVHILCDGLHHLPSLPIAICIHGSSV